MSKTGFDHDALVEQFAHASAKQGEALRQAVQQATLKALQGRELTLKSVRDAVKATPAMVIAERSLSCRRFLSARFGTAQALAFRARPPGAGAAGSRRMPRMVTSMTASIERFCGRQSTQGSLHLVMRRETQP